MEIRTTRLETVASDLRRDLFEPAYGDVLDDRLREIAATAHVTYTGLAAYEHERLAGYAHLQTDQSNGITTVDILATNVAPLPATAALLEAARTAATGSLHWWNRGKSIAFGAELSSGIGHEVRRVIRMSRTNNKVEGQSVPTRAFTPQDGERVVAINNAAFHDHADRSSWTTDDLTKNLSSLENRYEDLLLAPAINGTPDEVNGFCWIKRHDGSIGEIYVLATHPAAQGTGLGSALLRRGLHYIFDELQAATAVLFTEANNTHARALYERNGFITDNADLVSFEITANS